MERIISEQDRIRRAEEIAGRRKGTISARNINVTNTRKKMPLLTKLFIQTIVSMCIFGLAYFLVQNKNPIIDNIRPVLNYDINIEQIYNELNNNFKSVANWYSGFASNNIEENELKNDLVESNVSNNVEDNEIEENTTEETNEIAGVGGSDENVVLSQDKSR